MHSLAIDEIWASVSIENQMAVHLLRSIFGDSHQSECVSDCFLSWDAADTTKRSVLLRLSPMALAECQLCASPRFAVVVSNWYASYYGTLDPRVVLNARGIVDDIGFMAQLRHVGFKSNGRRSIRLVFNTQTRNVADTLARVGWQGPREIVKDICSNYAGTAAAIQVEVGAGIGSTVGVELLLDQDHRATANLVAALERHCASPFDGRTQHELSAWRSDQRVHRYAMIKAAISTDGSVTPKLYFGFRPRSDAGLCATMRARVSTILGLVSARSNRSQPVA